MSSDKSDEFSLEGLEDLDLSEDVSEAEAVSAEDEGFELDLSSDNDDFSLAAGDEVENSEVEDPNEFSLDDAAVDLDLSAGEEAPSENMDFSPGDEFSLAIISGEALDEDVEETSLSEQSEESDEILSLDADDQDGLEDFSLSDELSPGDSLEDFSLGEEEGDELSLGEDLSEEASLEDFNLGEEELPSEDLGDDDLFSLGEVGSDESNSFTDPLKDYSSPKIDLGDEDLTEDVKAKLKEIDAIMEEDATIAAIRVSPAEEEEINSETNDGLDLDSLNMDELSAEMLDADNFELPEENLIAEETAEALETEDLMTSEDHLVSESLVGDLNLANLDIEEEGPEVEEAVAAPVTPKKKKKKETQAQASLNEIADAYTGEMERTQATIANLRADRDELLKRIDLLEEEKLLTQRNSLNLRAELDEKKIELTIIRKKLNEEINEYKDKIRIYEEKVLILEEKNKQLHQEIDTVGQKNKIDVKRVMLRERELEQKLELLKADAETQIRNRDLKILELKRKVDAMEFDMESISQQEKKTLESRFELEDKLDKAIRTLRTAISTLEEDGNRSSTLEAIKKNIEM